MGKGSCLDFGTLIHVCCVLSGSMWEILFAYLGAVLKNITYFSLLAAVLGTLTACSQQPSTSPPPVPVVKPSPEIAAEATRVANNPPPSNKPSNAEAYVEESKKGDWNVSREISRLDDSQNLILTLRAKIPVSSKLNSNYYPTLHLACLEKKLYAYIDWGTFVHNETASVTTRLDNTPAVTKRWLVSTDYQATFAPQTVRFIKSLVKHQTLVARVIPYADNPLLTEFDLTGLDTHIQLLNNECHIRN